MEAVTQKSSRKRLFRKFSQNVQENSCNGVHFLCNVVARNFIKIGFHCISFSVEFAKFFRISYSREHLWTADSAFYFTKITRNTWINLNWKIDHTNLEQYNTILLRSSRLEVLYDMYVLKILAKTQERRWEFPLCGIPVRTIKGGGFWEFIH